MSYAMRGFDGFDGLGVDVPVIDPITGSQVIEHPTADEPACGSVLGLQQMLTDLAYYKAPIDGLFTVDTFASLQHFCLDVGVPYRPGTYPESVVCSAVLAAWQNKQASKGVYPAPGYPVVLPGITPANRMAGVRAAAAAAARKCTPADKPPIAASGLWGLRGILGSIAFGGFGAFDPNVMPTIGQGRANDTNAVKIWQTFLGIQADGAFGSGTKAATVAWQNTHGLAPGDGVVGPKTWTAAAASLATQPPPVSIPIPPIPGLPPQLPPAPPTGGGTTTTTGTTPTPSDPGSVPPPPQNPIERAQAWWTSQPKPTQYAVMGGAGIVLLGLLALAAGAGGKKKPATAQPNRRRYRRNGTKRRRARRGKRASCRKTAPRRYRRKGATSRSDYADPKCWGYPIRFRKGRKIKKKTTISHIKAAAARFGKYGRSYAKPRRRRIAARIRKAERRYAIGPYRRSR